MKTTNRRNPASAAASAAAAAAAAPSRRGSAPPRRRRRRGTISIVAMMYMVIMAALAIGLYAVVGTSLAMSGNDVHVNRSLNAAESGMQLVRYQLAQTVIPYNEQVANYWTDVWKSVQTAYNGTPNVNGHNPTLGTDPATGNPAIFIPGTSGSGANLTNNWMNVDAFGGQAYVAIVETAPDKLTVTAVGRNVNPTTLSPISGTISRAVQYQYGISVDASSIFNYGVASKSAISMKGNAKITGVNPAMGSVLSAAASGQSLSMTGSDSISGDFSYMKGTTQSFGGGTIANEVPTQLDFHNHIHALNQAPEFPVIDTSPYMAAAPPKGSTGTNVLSTNKPGKGPFANIRIPANTNPSFQANTVINGVMVVEMPNSLSFTGGVTINGYVVVDTTTISVDPTTKEPVMPANDAISFAGNVTAGPVPSGSQYSQLAGLQGAFMLAPGANVSFGGNFGTIGGAIIASQLSFSGNAGGTINGSVIMQNTLPSTASPNTMSMGGNATIKINSQGTTQVPSGVHFGSHFAPNPGSYAEVAAQ